MEVTSSCVRKLGFYTEDFVGEGEGQGMGEITCHIFEGFFEEDKIPMGNLPLLSKFLSFYLTAPLLARLLWVQ